MSPSTPVSEQGLGNEQSGQPGCGRPFLVQVWGGPQWLRGGLPSLCSIFACQACGPGRRQLGSRETIAAAWGGRGDSSGWFLPSLLTQEGLGQWLEILGAAAGERAPVAARPNPIVPSRFPALHVHSGS